MQILVNKTLLLTKICEKSVNINIFPCLNTHNLYLYRCDLQFVFLIWSNVIVSFTESQLYDKQFCFWAFNPILLTYASFNIRLLTYTCCCTSGIPAGEMITFFGVVSPYKFDSILI